MTHPDPPSEPLPAPAPLEYAHPAPRKPRLNILLVIFGLLTSKTTRLVYLILCSIGFFFVFRFLLHYRQILEDAMNAKK